MGVARLASPSIINFQVVFFNNFHVGNDGLSHETAQQPSLYFRGFHDGGKHTFQPRMKLLEDQLRSWQGIAGVSFLC